MSLVLETLGSARRCRRQIDRLQARHAGDGRLQQVEQRGVSLARLVLDKGGFARRLAREVRAGTYRFSEARVREVRLDKMRQLYSFVAGDLILHGVFAELLVEQMESRLSDRVFSYRRGRSAWQAAHDFAGFVRQHVEATPDVRARGIHVLRCDVKSYGDTIPVDDSSRLWALLAGVLRISPRQEPREWKLIQHIVRPALVQEDGPPRPRKVGVPIGSPAATALTNLYLDPLDHVLETIDGLWYARYGDDLLLAHPDADGMERARRELLNELQGAKLSLNPRKIEHRFFNGAGRPSPAGQRGTTAVTYLGCRIGFHGQVGLSDDKIRALISDVRARVRRSARMLEGVNEDERGEILCAVANAALDPRHPMASPHAGMLRFAVNDRGQLRHVDHWVGRAIVATMAGHPGARGLRRFPFSRLRQWGLASALHARNKYGGGR